MTEGGVAVDDRGVQGGAGDGRGGVEEGGEGFGGEGLQMREVEIVGGDGESDDSGEVLHGRGAGRGRGGGGGGGDGGGGWWRW